MNPIVFLHVPKTAGQTVHNELVRAVGGEEHVSPVRVQWQAQKGQAMPPGYRLYSGHINWTELDSLPPGRFAFTILRDPRERIASFYLYMLKEAQALRQKDLDRPENTGKKMILQLSADDYFFGGDENWSNFVRNMYDNFYCSYFATRRMGGRPALARFTQTERIDRALAGLNALSAVYSIEGLEALERDIAERYGQAIQVAGNYYNTGDHAQNEARWPKLCARFERDDSARRLEAFTSLDEFLMERVFARAPVSCR